MRKTITITLEDHKVVSCILSEEDGWTREMGTAETAAYLLAWTDLVDVALRYEGPIWNSLGKEQVLSRQRDFQYRLAERTILDEATGQLTPWMALKLIITSPIWSTLNRIASADCHSSYIVAFMKRFVLPPAKSALMAFVFRRQNAKNIEALLEEAHRKYYGDQQRCSR